MTPKERITALIEHLPSDKLGQVEAYLRQVLESSSEHGADPRPAHDAEGRDKAEEHFVPDDNLVL
ncbi:MAG TPA: hypothetical protein VGN26_02565 [Armatimonadota bacterium]|jgi:hypothetical protein